MTIGVDYFETDLEEALDIAGIGKYQLFHCALMLCTLGSALLEIVGNAFILPAAACDLQLPDTLKGILTSIPSIGVIITAPLWGRAADTMGRKPVMLFSTAAAGVICFLASFMPTLASFAICKFAGSLFLACPSSVGWAYAGELVPRRRRDRVVLMCNGMLMLSSTLSPLIAWAILSYDWHYQLGDLLLRPWRLLTAVYALPMILTAMWITRADESPKFLMTKGKRRQALEVLRNIYSVNTGLPWGQYCVTSLRVECSDTIPISGVTVNANTRNQSAFELFKPPHLKWLILCGFLMFGIFSLLNGLFLFAADSINKILRGPEEVGTICLILNETESKSVEACVDTMSHDTFMIMVITTLVYSVIVLAASLCPLNKRTLLITMFTTVGVTCLISGVVENRMVAGVAMTSLQLTALGIGPLTAFAIHLFPTRLRGTAIGAILMFGRLGSVVGANAAGYLLAVACSIAFYGFSSLLFVCAALGFLLPKHHVISSNGYLDTDTR